MQIVPCWLNIQLLIAWILTFICNAYNVVLLYDNALTSDNMLEIQYLQQWLGKCTQVFICLQLLVIGWRFYVHNMKLPSNTWYMIWILIMLSLKWSDQSIFQFNVILSLVILVFGNIVNSWTTVEYTDWN